MKISAIIPVAGQGKRFGGKTPKQFLTINNQSIIEITLKKFVSLDNINDGVVVVSESDIDFSRDLFRKIDGFENKFKVVKGGKKRQDSVYNGLQIIPSDTDIVVVHDGVRPLVSSQLITKSIQNALVTGACIAAIPVKDTIKRAQNDTVIETIPRDNLWQVQTPQSFRYSVLKEAHEKAKKIGFYSTDDSSIVEWNGHPVNIIIGEYSNIKITTKGDLELSLLLYQKESLK
jgi:2-C-methyl-D-erythritol 4-phosphate cytidylyltransferase